MRLSRLAVTLATLLLVGCATTVPPGVRVSDLSALAGTYSGELIESGELKRQAQLLLEPDGHFELRVSDPKGFRTLGQLSLHPDGTLRYGYKQLRGGDVVHKGTGTVHEGDGRRVIVLTTEDGSVTATVGRSLP